MAKGFTRTLLAGAALVALTSCSSAMPLPPQAGYGPNPQLPPPQSSLIPTVNIAPARAWPAGRVPVAQRGFAVAAFARDLTHPRWLYTLPNGDVLVAETNAPDKPVQGIKGWIMKMVIDRAGAGVPSPNRITLLRDTNGDGVAETRTVFLQGLFSPFGMANEVDRASGTKRLFASGLRNPNGMDWEPQTGVLWTVVNERDEIGDDLVPDYMTSVRDGGFYGWPYSYYGRIVDDRIKPQRPDVVARALVPDYALGSHTGTLGLAFYNGTALPNRYRGGAFIGQHGSWNRSVPNGYKVIFPMEGPAARRKTC